MDFKEIDFNELWKRAAKQTGPENGIPGKHSWDKRAEKFSQRLNRAKKNKKLDKEDYVYKMLERIEVQTGQTVLDIGCGPGLLTLPLAKKARQVTALDISSKMLERLKNDAANAGLSNISYVNSSWQKAFEAGMVDSHDIVVASRSLVSGDIQEALNNIARIARQAAYLTFPIFHLPFDFEVYEAIGRHGDNHPPYVYIYNMLYQTGIHANLEILYSKVKVQFYSIEEAVNTLQSRAEPFTGCEKQKLHEFLEKKFDEQGESPFFTHEGRSEWALIWWRKENLQERYYKSH